MSSLYAPARDREFGVLMSFHYFQKEDLSRIVNGWPWRPNIFTDSGGFSAHTQGCDVDLNDYARWIRKHQGVIDYYANLDVVYDWRKTLQNQLRMERLGLRPMPVLHFRSPVEEIERYKKRGYDAMCLGGLVPYNLYISRALASLAGSRDLADLPRTEGKEVIDWLDRCHEVANEVGMGLHGFGITIWRSLLRWHWKSVDSSSWNAASKYGSLRIFDGERGSWTKTVKRLELKGMMKIAPLLRKYNLSVSQLANDLEFTPTTMVRATAKSWLVAQRTLQTRREKATTIYLAGSNETELTNIVNGLCYRGHNEN